MKVSFQQSGNFSDTLAWLAKVSKPIQPSVIHQIARDGEVALSKNTPKDTGETASSWTSDITTRGNVLEVAWRNHAHPQSRLNVAKLIDLGHGTRNGGYVPPRPYIKQSMESVWKKVDNVVMKELVK